MNYSELVNQIAKKRSFLCVGLDTDFNKIPPHLQKLDRAEAMLSFNIAIIDATAPYTVAYKPNVAFYESEGSDGWEVLAQTIKYIQTNYPDIFVIADAKRGDIGNTSERYAHTFFDKLNADAVTVAPYMGKDSVLPFLQHEGKWTIILALTSNSGSQDFQHLICDIKEPLFHQVLKKADSWGSKENTMFVVGATQAFLLAEVRRYVHNHFLLVPGVGAQGGSLADVALYGMTKDCGLLVNSSRGIIYASKEKNFAEVAGLKAKELQEEMAQLLEEYSDI